VTIAKCLSALALACALPLHATAAPAATPRLIRVSTATDASPADALAYTTWNTTNPECPIHDIRFRVLTAPPPDGQVGAGKPFAWFADVEIGEYGHDDEAHGFKYSLVSLTYVVDGGHIDMTGTDVVAHVYGLIDAPDHMTLTFDYETSDGGKNSVPCLLKQS
jgi:hypothetical protein